MEGLYDNNPLEIQKLLRILKLIKMENYIFYNRRDKSKEHIGVVKALNLVDATRKFTLIKKLNVKEFTKMFSVEKKRK